MNADLPALLETHAKNIFSPHKAIRRNARVEFLRLTQDGTDYPEYVLGTSPLWVQVANALYNARVDKTFPYKIDPKRVSYENITIPGENPPLQGPVMVIQGDQTPAYVVLMAHGFNPAAANTIEKIQGQLQLLREEGFADTGASSRVQAQRRLRTVVGANFAYSLDSRVNRLGRQYLNALRRLTTIFTKVYGFTWIPQMTQDGKDKVAFKRAKRLFRLIREVDPAAATEICQNIYKKKPIPFSLIREVILNADPVLTFVTQLRRGIANRPVRAMTWDDDAIRLRIGGLGVFSRYDQMFAANNQLRMASTGYLMTHPEHDYVLAASEADYYCRIALGRVAYLPEPNLAVNVPVRATRGLGFKYNRNCNANDFLMESNRVAKSLNLDWTNSRGRIEFGDKNPIETAANRAVVPKGLRGHLTPQDFADPSKIIKFRSFMQASFDPLIGFSQTVLRALPGLGGQANNGKVYRLFIEYDFIEFTQSFRNWQNLYDPYIREFVAQTNLQANQRNFGAAARRILVQVEGPKPSQARMETYLRESVQRHELAEANLRAVPAMTDAKLLFIQQNALNVSFTLYCYFHAKATNQAFVMPDLTAA
ncbi:MAG: hypothetical protein KDK62_07685 [Chlamydiia bacterium]|nr:hypothetical protein [Chlamydiia bacterium]